MRLILTVAGHDVHDVTVNNRRRIRQIVRMHTELFHQIELPDDVRVLFASELFVLHRAVILAVVAEAFGVEADQFGAIGNVVEAVAFY